MFRFVSGFCNLKLSFGGIRKVRRGGSKRRKRSGELELELES